jgi:KaiC/GvpD/RAD55 family RecA-like ATPase
MTFAIREHLEQLTLDRETPTEYRCICPICEGNNLTIAKNSGAYNCWNGCPKADIRNALAPIPPRKEIRLQGNRTWIYTNAQNNSIIRTRRTDDGAGKRRIWQEYLINGRWQGKSTPETETAREAAKRAVMPYNYAAAIEAFASGEPVFWVEGEPSVDELETVGLTAITTIGGSAGYKTYGNYSNLLDGAKLILCPDGDRPGLKYAEAIAQDYPAAQWLYAFPDCPAWNNPAKDGGLDVADWVRSLRSEGLSAEQIRDRILGAVEPRRVAEHAQPPDTFEGYLDELKRLDGIPDPIRKDFEVFALSREIGIPQRTIEKAIVHLRSKTKPLDKTVFDLDEFLNLPLTATPWVVTGLVPSGETILLAGLPKEGKSLVGYDLAYSVATSRARFLGEQPIIKGRVLLVLSDESPRSIQGRLIKRGFTAEDSEQVRVMTRFNLQNLSELEAQLDEFRPCLTIIDSLKSITQGSEVSENSAEFGDAIYALKELLTKHDSAGVLVHHSNKDKEAQGVAQVRGSTAITGAVWGVWMLKTPRRRQGEEPPRDRWLEICPREGERKTLSIELDPSVNTWTLISSTQQSTPEQATAKDRVLELLRGMKGRRLEFSEIRDLLPEINPKTIQSALNRIVDDGVAGKRPSGTNPKRKVYFLDSLMDSGGFKTERKVDSDTDSRELKNGREAIGESNGNYYPASNSANGFKINLPRGRQGESIMDLAMDSQGFTEASEEAIEHDGEY